MPFAAHQIFSSTSMLLSVNPLIGGGSADYYSTCFPTLWPRFKSTKPEPAIANKASVVGSGTVSEKTMPSWFTPSLDVVPYRLPPDNVRLASGRYPLAPTSLKNEANTVDGPPAIGTENMAPALYLPPNFVVPYSVLPDNVRPATGPPPLVPLNGSNTVGVPPVIGSENTVPWPAPPP